MPQQAANAFDNPSLLGFANPQAEKWRLEALHRIAEAHLQNDLQQSDRDLLQQASKKVSVHYMVGSMIGLGLGALAAFRVRSARIKAFQAFIAKEKPKEIVFEGGRTEPIPDITPYVRPTTFGDIITYTFFSGAGIFIGGQLGLLSGASSAIKTVDSDPEARKRILDGFRKFRIDVLRKEVEDLESFDESKGWRVLGK